MKKLNKNAMAFNDWLRQKSLIFYPPHKLDELILNDFATPQKQILVALLATLAYFVLGFLHRPHYLTNDDFGIMSDLCGNTTGSPYPFPLFINVILGKIISFLYTILPQFQWWFIYSLTLTFIAIFAIQLFAIKIADVFSVPYTLAIFLLFVFTGHKASFFIYYINNIAFTIVSCFSGCAAMCAVFYAGFCENKKSRVRLFVLSGVLLFLSFIHRSSTGYVALCYILLAFLYYCAKVYGFSKKGVVVFLSVTILSFSFCVSIEKIDSVVKEKINGKEYMEFFHARAMYMDYPHDSYDENPELFEEPGWSKEVYEVSKYGAYFPDVITTESFLHICENSSMKIVKKEKLRQTFINAKSVLRNRYVKYLALSVIFFIILSFLNFDVSLIFFELLNLFGCGILLLYLCWGGRIVDRAIFVVVFPSLIITLLFHIILLRNFDFGFYLSSKTKKFDVSMINCGTFFDKFNLKLYVFLCVFAAASLVFGAVHYIHKPEVSHNIEIQNYCRNNEKNIYVVELTGRNNYNPASPWKVLTGANSVSNMITYGYSGYKSDSYCKSLKVNGVDSFEDGKLFLKENVYFITGASEDEKDSALVAILNYLNSKYGKIRVEKVEDIPETQVSVLKFVQF